MGYIVCANSLRANFFPNAQLQVIYPLTVMERVNNIPAASARQTARAFSQIARTAMGAVSSKVSFFEAVDLPTAQLTQSVQRVIAANPELEKSLLLKASKRNSDFAEYAAAHLMVHDGPTSLEPLDRADSEQPNFDCIISIGAQSERIFYLTRMACRAAGVLPAQAVQKTGQIFTKHILPPYIPCRQGEPSFTQANVLRMLGPPFEHPVPSVERDIQYFQSRCSLEPVGTPLPPPHERSYHEPVYPDFGGYGSASQPATP